MFWFRFDSRASAMHILQCRCFIAESQETLYHSSLLGVQTANVGHFFLVFQVIPHVELLLLPAALLLCSLIHCSVCLQLLEILEISWNLKFLLEILEISWNFVDAPGKSS